MNWDKERIGTQATVYLTKNIYLFQVFIYLYIFILKEADPNLLRKKKEKYQIQLQRLTANCMNSNNNYRSAVRDTLHLQFKFLISKNPL